MTEPGSEKSVADAAWDNGVSAETYMAACEGPPWPLPAFLLALSAAQSVAAARAHALDETAVAYAMAAMSIGCLFSGAVAAVAYFSSLRKWRSAMDECRRVASGVPTGRYARSEGGVGG